MKKIFILPIIILATLLAGCTRDTWQAKPQENGCIVYQCIADMCNPKSYVRCPNSQTTAARDERHGKVVQEAQSTTVDK